MTVIDNQDEQRGDVNKMTPDAPIISKNENTAAIMRPKKFILLSEKSDLAETLNSYQDSKRKAGFKPKILNTK